MTNGSRCIGLPSSLTSVNPSTIGLCKSTSLGHSGLSYPAAFALATSACNSSIEPTHFICPSSLRHTGRGVPQYRSREIAQSLTFLSHSPNRPSPTQSGAHSTSELNFNNCSLTAVMRTNHESIA